MSNRAWRIGIAQRFTLGNSVQTRLDTYGSWGAPAWTGAAEAIVRQAIFDGQSASLAITLDSATLSSTVNVGAVGVNCSLAVTLDSSTLAATGTVLDLASLSKQLDAATLSSTTTVLDLASLSLQLGDAALASEVDSFGSAALAVQLDDATLAAVVAVTVTAAEAGQLDDATFAAAADVLVRASAAITLDDASLACLLNTTGAVFASLAITLDDAALSSSVTVTPIAPPVSVTLPVRGGSGRRKGGAIGPPVYIGTYQDEPPRAVARVVVRLDDARIEATATVGRAARLEIALDSCTMSATVEVNWLEVIADEDALLILLAAA